jgi:heme-degrading monooxygenase HmoA
MILEIAQIDVTPGLEDEFEAGVKAAVAVFRRAKGCKGLELQRGIEQPSRYRLLVKWETVENHTMDSAAPPISRNGASSSAIASRRPRMWSIRER